MPRQADAWGPALGALALLAASGGLLWLGLRRFRLWRRVADTPTARVRSAPMGVVELKGLAQPLGSPLCAPFSGAACCYWRVTVDQEEIVQTKNGSRREWRQIHAENSLAAFLLDDLGATLRVDPAGADVECPRLLEHVSGSALAWLGRLAGREGQAVPSGPGVAVWLSGGWLGPRRRLREWRIDTDRPLYVLGVQRHGEDGNAVGRGRQGEPFLISTESEDEVLRRLRWGVLGWLLAATLAFGLALWLLILLL